jgi:hypothetical protein
VLLFRNPKRSASVRNARDVPIRVFDETIGEAG